MTVVFEFKLPDVGEGIHEGEIVNWLVKEGDAVKENQPILNVMTDKATVEITSPRTGRIAKILAPEGKVVKVGDVMVTIEEGAGPSGTPAHQPPASARESPSGTPAHPSGREDTGVATAAKEEKTLFELPKDIPLGTRRIRRGGAGAGPTVQMVSREKTLATPSTRRLARELSVDINKVPATGPTGRVTKEDIQRFAASGTGMAGAVSQTAPPQTGAAPMAIPRAGAEERVPFRGLRKKIAEQMVRSKHTATHFTYVEEVNVTKLVHFRDASKQHAEEVGVKLTYLPFIIKATVAALKKHGIVNSSLDETTQELVYKKYYNVGIALDTPDGLMVPVVKDCDRKNIFDIAREIDRLAEAGRNKKIALDDLKGGTFTITSLGRTGGLFATPIINYPEVAIMGVHKIAERPVVEEGKIVVGHVMNLSFSFDHRVVDGAEGARFAQDLVRYLEHPQLLILEHV